MRILAVIPARGGSKGIPRKNIKLLKGKPLIQYSIEAAKQSQLLTTCIVSTEDEEIAKVSKKLGIRVPFMRPRTLSQDDTPTLPVIKHALEYFKGQGESFDVVCILQTTTPFREKNLIDKAIKKLIETDADALISVRTVPHEYNPHWVFEPNSNGFLDIATGEKTIIPRRQDLPPAYIRDGAIYLTKVRCIMLENSLYGSRLTHLLHDSKKHVNLDRIEDWHRAEEILNQA